MCRRDQRRGPTSRRASLRRTQRAARMRKLLARNRGLINRAMRARTSKCSVVGGGSFWSAFRTQLGDLTRSEMEAEADLIRITNKRSVRHQILRWPVDSRALTLPSENQRQGGGGGGDTSRRMQT